MTAASCCVAWLVAACFAQEASGHAALKSKVFVVHHPQATEAFKARHEIVKAMVQQGLTNVAGQSSVDAAWRTFVSARDTVGIKVYSAPGALSGTRKEVVEAVVQGLLAAGLPGSNIIIWDKHGLDLQHAGFSEMGQRLGVRVRASQEAGYDYNAYYESPIIGNLVWGDLDFGRGSEYMGRKSYFTRLVSRELTKIINISPLLNHNGAGVCGNLYSLAIGAVDNASRFEWNSERLAQAVPEIYATEWLSDKVVLNITDALICQYEGGERTLLHYSLTPNELWISKDPVALDTLGTIEVSKHGHRQEGSQRRRAGTLYENAALLELGQNDTNNIEVLRLEVFTTPVAGLQGS